MDRCDECELLYLNPAPDESAFPIIYPANYHAFAFDAQQFGIIHRIRRRLEARRLLKVFGDLPADAKILDVGCGDGFHLGLIKEFGLPTWQVEGIDTSERAVTQARKNGLNVHCGTVESVAFEPASFNAVILIMTVEHVNDPAGLLNRIHELLKPGGRVLIVTDNADSIDAKLFQKSFWGGYHFPRHTFLFNRRSLTLLANQTRFEVYRLQTIVSPVNWVYSIRNYLVGRKYPQWLIRQFSLTTPIPLAIFTILDNLFCLFGRGALLQAVLVKPIKEQAHES